MKRAILNLLEIRSEIPLQIKFKSFKFKDLAISVRQVISVVSPVVKKKRQYILYFR